MKTKLEKRAYMHELITRLETLFESKHVIQVINGQNRCRKRENIQARIYFIVNMYKFGATHAEIADYMDMHRTSIIHLYKRGIEVIKHPYSDKKLFELMQK